MIVIKESDNYLMQLLGNQKIDNVDYRPFLYTYFFEHENGLILFNILTNEVLWLTKAEKIFFSEYPDINNYVVKKLIEKWFLVPIKYDDTRLPKQINEVKKIITSTIKNDIINNFIIYTTTECNARCFYCYEHNSRKVSMTSKTANDVASFIIKKSKGEKVFIQWFGGEPLYNVEAINIICDTLNKQNIDFESTMISNGYLFNETIIKKALNWHLKSVQITLDGTECVYNKIKSYIYKDNISPFIRVTDNIELLLKANIAVRIRLNMDKNNADNINQLISLLIDRYNQYSICKIHVEIIVDYLGKSIPQLKERELLYKYQRDLNNKIIKNGMNIPHKISSPDLINKLCMADSDNSTTILPDGKLGKCEHYLDDNFWGDIYSDEIDNEVIDSFKKIKKISSDCEKCRWTPICEFLLKCACARDYCDVLEIERLENSVKESLINDYKNYFLRSKIKNEIKV